ncbi:DUF4861 family protein [Sphingomonas aquatilis]|uniref:DUF4861 domain-containing protein n=1 Tax=Sphingomonas aquatilis TaxID=93063 RepID=A0AAW3TNV4_9SPHN|nr:DUF4861 family protein [Sphingomonas aquatilis]MBB3874284.1 hypothetical protein [Sphingomonas aquatilis]
MARPHLPLPRRSMLAVLPLLVAASPQPSAPATDAPQAAVVFAPYRHDDLLWENDRTAHRIYGHALEAAEPPSSSGIDAWGKAIRAPFMDRQLRTGDQHADHGEGLDFYDVHGSRGAGGLGIWYDNKLWTSRNFIRHRILSAGPKVADFAVDYAPWPVDVVRKVWETRRFTLPTRTNFTRMTSTLQSDTPAPLTVGIGIAKRATDGKPGSFAANAKTGRFTWWGATNPKKGTMGVALMVDPAAIAGVTEDYDNYLVLVTVMPGKPFVYYMGAAWDRGPDIHDRAQWQAYVDAQTPSFLPSAR